MAVPHRQEWIDLGLVNASEMQQFRAEGLAELKAQGKQPNYGLAPFERMAGLEKPPEPVG